MSVDSVNYEHSTKTITWEALVQDSEDQINELSNRIAALKKSIIFFKKKIMEGDRFPDAPTKIRK